MDKIIPKLKELHKIAFGDSDLYIDFFFEKRFSKDKCFYITDDEGNPISVVYSRDFDISLFGNKMQVPFLTGIATHPNHRKKNLATKVINDSLKILRTQGHPFIMLHPFNTEFYQKLDFETINYAEKITLNFNGEREGFSYRKITKDDIPVMTKLYEHYSGRYPFYRIRTKNTISELWQEHSQDGGEGFITSINGIPNSYIISGEGKVFEYIGEDFTQLFAIKELEGNEATILASGGNPYSMATVGDISALVSIIPYKENAHASLTISIDGKSYYWLIEKGGLKEFYETDATPDITVSSRQFIAITLGNGDKYASDFEKEFLSLFPNYNLFMYEKF